ncbi:MAG: phenol hydroxylase subunit [Candidatus Thiodiazotropha sp. (ex. Lucinisca nassula)]|nr:phenol hydroxylase subunit [Candidatus Thiodiazotropha sp. (ex. Lucinisca nassula)]MBW9270317.1 phenol hydroxylase subunit [Candidatus Thiodiazotropha sp. (ex. Lucinisca nassula)]
MREYVPKIGQAYIRVTGERLGKFVEFEFSIDDEDLTVELILPHEAFKIFCDKHQARLVRSSDEIGAEESQTKRPGLYRESTSL